MKKLTVSMTRGEQLAGWSFLAAQQLLLPHLLAAVNTLPGLSMDALGLNVAFFAVSFLSTLLIFRRFLGRSLKQLLCRPLQVLGIAVAGCIAYWFLSYLVGFLIFLLMPDFSNVNDSAITQMAQNSFWLIALCTVILVPVAEEALFRGLLFGCLYQRARLVGYLLSTAAFCAIHVVGYIGLYPWDVLLLCFVSYIPAGLCLSWAYVKTDCFFTPVIMHTIINAVSMFAMR